MLNGQKDRSKQKILDNLNEVETRVSGANERGYLVLFITFLYRFGQILNFGLMFVIALKI
jgi:hypothetical protein